MQRSDDFRNLRFDRQLRRVPSRLVVVAGATALFAVLWLAVPTAVLLLPMLIVVAALLWVASYGWRGAAAALRALLDRLESL